MNRLDVHLVKQGLVTTRSQAESYIKLGWIKINGQTVTKAGYIVKPTDNLSINSAEQYVSRAALKLASAAAKLELDFKDKTVLDVGSSTGGFSDYALRHGAARVIAVDVGTNQLHPSLRADTRIELHEKTDIRSFRLSQPVELVLIDVSFIGLREVLPAIANLAGANTLIVAMLKPQFEAGPSDTNKGVIKNDRLRRRVIKDFEDWLRGRCVVIAKADSEISGAKGNLERFYLLKSVAEKGKRAARVSDSLRTPRDEEKP